MTNALQLKRIAPGAYETADGNWAIEQGGPENPSWAKEWVVRHTRVHGIYSDPVPTLREAKRVLVSMVAARAAGRI